MNKLQIVVLWLAGMIISYVFSTTGWKLLVHAASSKETWETGYPITLMVGTVWTYIFPVVIIGAVLIYSSSGWKSKRRKK